MRDFDLFAAYSYLYFAAASFGEASQRLLPAPEGGGHWAWEGFLGSGDPILEGALDHVLTALRESPWQGFEDEVRRAIAPRNIAGLADPARRRLYPVDLESLVASAGLLGLPADAVRREVPRLRGSAGRSLTLDRTRGDASLRGR
jgi:hypothetical protein